jgi:hypothetical protein
MKKLSLVLFFLGFVFLAHAENPDIEVESVQEAIETIKNESQLDDTVDIALPSTLPVIDTPIDNEDIDIDSDDGFSDF